MMMLLLPLLAAAATARVFDSLPAVPDGWKEIRKAKSAEPIALRIALRQQRAEALQQAVMDISTPGHPNYGMHMTREEVRAYTAPSATAVSGVTTWLGQYSITPEVDNDWVSITTTASIANELLNTTFAWYEYDAGGGPKLRTLSYSVPDEVAGHVDLVQPTTRFGQLSAKMSSIFDVSILDDVPVAKVGAAKENMEAEVDVGVCGAVINPDCLKSLYNINYTAKADGNLIAFTSYLEQYARYADLEVFVNEYVPAATGQNFTVELINAGKDDQTSAQGSRGRGPFIPPIGDPYQPNENEPYLEFLTYLLAKPDCELPQTLSTSYGEPEQSVPEGYALKVCNMFMQLGARGVSVLFSSGDSGPGRSCKRNTDGATFFNPTFPAGCPWVTAVGGTGMTEPERAVSFSSGGFSIYHSRPAYQDTAVAAYLQSIGSTYASYFNASGRGIPDVAAQGVNFTVVDKGRIAMLAGTSASCPTFASIIALLNAARKTQGLPSLGFLNPWLYNNSGAFTDITSGAGVGCRNHSDFAPTGARWNATAGWDPVTGLGTPKFDLLLAVAAPGVANE